MKYRILALFMACFYLFPSLSVFASELNTSASSSEESQSITEASSEGDTFTEDDSVSDTTKEEFADSDSLKLDETLTIGASLSTIREPSDGGCIISGGDSSNVNVSAQAAVLMDASSGAILYSKDPDTRYYPASITKIVTTLVALEKGNLSDDVLCKKDTLYAIEQGSSRIGLEPDEIISLEDALYFTMLASGNDAAAVAAEHVGGTIDNFVAMMNEKVKEIGCTDTHFMNPHGLHSEEHYTTARDMALIMQAAVQNPDFCKIASATNFTVEATNLNDQRGTWNHHKMILPASEYHYDGVCEGKTGFTSIARNTLVTTAEKNGIKLIVVLLKGTSAANNYYETEALFDYGFTNFTFLKPLDDFNLKTAAEEAGLSEENLEKLVRYNAIYNTDYTIFAPADVTLDQISVTFSSDGPSEGIFGQLHIHYNNTEIGTLNVYYDVNEEYKSIANSDTDVSITLISKIPFVLVGIMAVLILLILYLGTSILFKR